MALGGGVFTSQNKVLPGSYINFVSVKRANASLSNRGVATMALELDWGVDGEVFEITNKEFREKSKVLFGYDYNHEKLRGLRDIFLNINTLYCYKLSTGGVKASNVYGVSKHSGIRGNDFLVCVRESVKEADKFEVSLMLDSSILDIQIVGNASELVDNDFIVWNKINELSLTTGMLLEGGTNGTVTGESHQVYLNKIESYSYNTMGVLTTDSVTKGLYTAFNKRMREEVGAKFQTVLYQNNADYEGIINVKNSITNIGWSESSLIYWVTGISAGCLVNKSNLNRKYDGEFHVNADFTQVQLSVALLAGEFTLHRVGGDIRVLSDINSLVTVTEDKGNVFKDNQTIRVIDQIANDIGTLFNTKYLGVIPNDASGRVSLWADIVKHHEQLQEIRAIENFSDKDIIVEQGTNKVAVVISNKITVVGTMAQIYMTVKVV